MSLDTIFDHFESEKDKEEAKEEFAVLHPYGKEAAILSDLQPHKIADPLTLAKTCFKSGNERFACFYLEEHIRKAKETRRFKMVSPPTPLEDKEDIVFFCYDTFSPKDDDPIVKLILSLCEKKYSAFNIRFESEDGTPYEIFFHKTKIFFDVEDYKFEPGDCDLFTGFLLAGYLNKRTDELNMDYQENLSVDQAMFLFDYFKNKKEVVADIFNSMGSLKRIHELMRVSRKTPSWLAISFVGKDEYGDLSPEILPAFVDSICEEGIRLDKELLEILKDHKHLFAERFEGSHTQSSSEFYHSLGLEPIELRKLSHPIPYCGCKQIISATWLEDYVEMFEAYVNGSEPSEAMWMVSQGKLIFSAWYGFFYHLPYADWLQKFKSLVDKIPEEYIPTIDLSEAGKIYISNTGTSGYLAVKDAIGLFKTVNSPFETEKPGNNPFETDEDEAVGSPVKTDEDEAVGSPVKTETVSPDQLD